MDSFDYILGAMSERFTDEEIEKMVADAGACGAICEHGGACSILKGEPHAMHSASGFCEWDNEEDSHD